MGSKLVQFIILYHTFNWHCSLLVYIKLFIRISYFSYLRCN